MPVTTGDTLPDSTFLELGPDGPQQVAARAITQGRKVVLFAVSGAYTGVCSTQHVPSFIRTADAIRAKGIDEIFCVAVNDPFVMGAWVKDTGADTAGIRFLSDAQAEFTKALGLDFTAPPVGLVDRSRRYAMLVEDGTVRLLNIEDSPGTCETSAGETLLDQLA